jgi:hypothetical protein
MSKAGMLYGPTFILLENGAHFQKEIRLQERFVRAAVRPGAELSEFQRFALELSSKKSIMDRMACDGSESGHQPNLRPEKI